MSPKPRTGYAATFVSGDVYVAPRRAARRPPAQPVCQWNPCKSQPEQQIEGTNCRGLRYRITSCPKHVKPLTKLLDAQHTGPKDFTVTPLASLAGLPAVDTDTDTDALQHDIVQVIKRTITDHPRSQQTEIGPSEIGGPCDRRLAHKLLGTPPKNAGQTKWRPAVGTATHAWLADAFMQNNSDPARWLVELRVNVGTVNGRDIVGSADLYDRRSQTVIDWKIVSATSLKSKRAHGPGDQYRVQVHAYGKGMVARGLPVTTVMIVFLPMAGELEDAYVWHEPYDEQVAVQALARLERIDTLTKAFGTAAPAVLSTADAFCAFCPYLSRDTTVLELGCPGDPASPVNNARTGFEDILAATPAPAQKG